MKYFIKVWILAVLSVVALHTSTFASFFEAETPRIHYCDDAGECGLDSGVNQIKNWLTDIEKDRTLSQYIQDITVYLLMFVTIVAVLYIIYAWFQIMIGGGEEEKVKKGKETIKYVIIGIVLMWLAYSIVAWILRVLNLAWATV